MSTHSVVVGVPLELPLHAKEHWRALDLVPSLVSVVRSNGLAVFFNRAWREYAPEAVLPFASDQWTLWVHKEDRVALLDAWKTAAPTNVPFRLEIRLVCPEGHQRWYMVEAQPIAEESNEKLYCVSLTDIDAHKLKAFDLVRRSRLQADMLNLTEDCIKVLNPDGTLSHMNKAGCEALNVDPLSGFGMDWLPLLPSEVRDDGREALRLAQSGSNARFAGASLGSDGEMRYWDNMLTPVKSGRGEVDAILVVSRDVTVQSSNEKRIALLLRELNHRSKNLFSVIQSLIRRTVPNAEAGFVRVLEQRISAIAKNQDVMIKGKWIGARIRDIVVSQTVVGGEAAEKQIALPDDPGISLRSEAAEVIGLALHELTTNAIKYGALSRETGRISVSWHCVGAEDDAERFQLQWRETGGPEVSAPQHHGFGTMLIERNPRAVLGAIVSCSYEPDGLIWTLDAPLKTVLAT